MRSGHPQSAVDRILERTQVVPAPIDHAFAFFADPWNLASITPPWLRFEIADAPRALETDALLLYRLHLFGIPVAWRTTISEWRPPRTFTDVQLAGPYRRWEHTHRLTPVAEGTEIYYHVRYRLPYEPVASLVARWTVVRWLDAIFDYRAARIEELLRS
jgi:ligand-binding SRPBCC domain-containing protein